jgi:hypothetical protein
MGKSYRFRVKKRINNIYTLKGCRKVEKGIGKRFKMSVKIRKIGKIIHFYL